MTNNTIYQTLILDGSFTGLFTAMNGKAYQERTR